MDQQRINDFVDGKIAWTVEDGPSLKSLKFIPDGYVQTVVTSPPYFGLRSYLKNGHPDKKWEIGAEEIPDCLGWATGSPCGSCFVCHLVGSFREVRRVLHRSGTIWVNLGDCYTSGNRNGHGTRVGYKQQTNRGMNDMTAPIRAKMPDGLKPKDLMMMPSRLALALQADGWYLRSDVVWHKPNSMCESVEDRPTRAHEQIFLLAKSERYYYDFKESQELAVTSAQARRAVNSGSRKDLHGPTYSRHRSSIKGGQSLQSDPDGMRNCRTVWEISTSPVKAAHFAVFPPELPDRCIRLTSSERGCCPHCRSPWKRVAEKTAVHDLRPRPKDRIRTDQSWKPTCRCPEHEPVPCAVLDPFAGSGTTGMVARNLDRRFIGLELNHEYANLARKRIGEQTPFFDHPAVQETVQDKVIYRNGDLFDGVDF